MAKDALALRNLGSQQAWITIGRRGSDFWGTSGSPSTTNYRSTTDEDYDQQFVFKLQKWRPVYHIDEVIEHHYNYYRTNDKQGHDEFMKHMRYYPL